MTATPLPDLLARLDELNNPAYPFVFRADGERIVGRWDVAHIEYVVLLGAGRIDEEYRIDVTFDQDKGTYAFEEHQRSGESHAAVSPNGTLSFGGSINTFKGSQKRIQRGFVAGTRVRTPDGDGVVAGWDFDTDRIKAPLTAFLEGHGWERKKGLFGRLFD